MKAQEAFIIVSKQIQKNKQNLELLEVLQKAVDLYDSSEEIESSYELPGFQTSMAMLDNLCIRYDSIEEEE